MNIITILTKIIAEVGQMADFEIITKKGERMIVLYPNCPSGQAARLRGHYKIALVPESLLSDTALAFTASNFVSYGSGRHSSITLSSISKGKIMAAVEKELPVLGGGVVEQQELAVENPKNASPEQLLAVLGRNMLTGGQS